ncbi:MAG: molybdopterin molybdotransferase MoeA [Candidatus Obscuribacterales bacterium]|nr:molybdopterin molybdotransferase MoeA [Candidatus Obscuribacterales bacterium]
MISFEEARATILENVQTAPKTRIKLEKLLGSVLGEPVIANYDMPHFDNSAVDGYAVCLADVREASSTNPIQLPVAGEVRPGEQAPSSMPSGSAFRIFTGAAVPLGADAVVMKEVCENLGDTVKIGSCPTAGDHIRRRGEEFLRGKQILPEGMRITPAVVGVLASLGQASFMVRRKPTVAVISTGNELLKPGKNLTSGKVYDSNSFALIAALEALGIEEFLPLHCREDASETKKVLGLALDFADVVITAGGISVGDHDYVKPVLEDLGVKTLFYKVAMKPGKPVFFGLSSVNKKGKRQYVFGLPGNPVSALVTFHQLVRPAILKIMGEESSFNGRLPEQFKATLMSNLKKHPDRMEFVRAVVSMKGEEMIAYPCEGQDSHMLGGLAAANALIMLPTGSTGATTNDRVDVVLLNWHG